MNSSRSAINTIGNAYKSKIHKSTGLTPADLMIGRNIRLPVDLVLPPIPAPEQEHLAQYTTEYTNRLEDRLRILRAFSRERLVLDRLVLSRNVITTDE